MLIAISAVTALQFLFTYAPFMEAFFDTRPLDLVEGLRVIVVGIALLLVLELEKRTVATWRRRGLFARMGRRQNRIAKDRSC